ncbi:hypothetical protein KC363_g107 [Hortaea werneckii]|nr:hypothetical protein KC363_g107 [Hortaea werneckii]
MRGFWSQRCLCYIIYKDYTFSFRLRSSSTCWHRGQGVSVSGAVDLQQPSLRTTPCSYFHAELALPAGFPIFNTLSLTAALRLWNSPSAISISSDICEVGFSHICCNGDPCSLRSCSGKYSHASSTRSQSRKPKGRC